MHNAAPGAHPVTLRTTGSESEPRPNPARGLGSRAVGITTLQMNEHVNDKQRRRLTQDVHNTGLLDIRVTTHGVVHTLPGRCHDN